MKQSGNGHPFTVGGPYWFIDHKRIIQNETITVTLQWQGPPGTTPPHDVYLIVRNGAEWQAVYPGQPGDQIDGSGCTTSDGAGDPYIPDPSPGPNGSAGGASRGTHLVHVDGSSGTIILTYTTNIWLVLFETGYPGTEYDIQGNTYCFVCVLDKLNPMLPLALLNSDPVIFYHGTDRQTADAIVAGLQLEERGSADFGKGFYTASSETTAKGSGLQLAKNSAWRRVKDKMNTSWGVVKFSIPLSSMLEFLCANQANILGFTDTSESATPPWNARPSPGFVYPYLKNPIPIPPGAPMNWFNFCWFNWYAMRCTPNPSNFADDEGTPNYIPDWGPQSFASLPDWGMALTWGKLYLPDRSCGSGNSTMPKGKEWDSPRGGYGLNQYVWGTGGGLAFINNTNVVTRTLEAWGDKNPLPMTTSGHITLQDVVNSAQPITFEFRPTNGGTGFTRTTTLASDGYFALTNLTAGTYNLAIKGTKWLRKIVPVDISLNDVTNLTATLLAGDADNNNTVDFDDMNILAIAYNTAQGDPLYDDRADFNCDGSVDFDDLTLLATNYNMSGDP